MATISSTEVRKDFASTLNRVAYRGERILIEKNGKRIAALVSAEDLELLEKLENAVDLDAAKAVLATLEEDGTVPLDEFLAKFKLS